MYWDLVLWTTAQGARWFGLFPAANLAVLAAQPYWFDRQMGQAPVGGPVKHGVEGERTPLHRALHPMPAPAQMDHEGQDSAGQAPFGLD